MRNNTRGLFIHILVAIIMFALATCINMNSNLVKILYGNVLFKIIIALIPICLYYNLGKGLSKKLNSKLDFFAGNIIVLICIILGVVSLIGINSKDNIEVAGTLWRLPFDVFMFPEVYLLELLGIKAKLLNVIISSLIPTIIYGISIKKSRAVINRHNRRMNVKKKR